MLSVDPRLAFVVRYQAAVVARSGEGVLPFLAIFQLCRLGIDGGGTSPRAGGKAGGKADGVIRPIIH